MKKNDPNLVPILTKTVEVLVHIAAGTGDTTARGVAKALKIAPTTTYRILRTLQAKDWVRALPGGTHELSFGLLPLLEPLMKHELLIQTVAEPLQQLAQSTRMTVKLSVRQAEDAVTIYRVEGPSSASVSVRVGAKYHLAEAGSSGVVLMSQMSESELDRVFTTAPAESWQHYTKDQLRKLIKACTESGVCLLKGAYRSDVAAVAAPLLDQQGRLVAALSLIGFASDFAEGAGERIKNELIFTIGGCNRLISSAGASRPPPPSAVNY